MNNIPRYLFLLFAVSAVLIGPRVGAAQTSLNPMLTPFLARYSLPAVAAAVVKEGKLVAAGVVGTRRADAKIPVTINDRFHIGSDTKAMTALLAAMMVEEGKLRWDSTLADVFPELAEKMDPRMRSVALERLLSHTGGLPTDNEAVFRLYGDAMSREGNLDKMRYWLVGEWSKRPPESEPGSAFAYSNLGYIIGGRHDRAGRRQDLGRIDQVAHLQAAQDENGRPRAAGVARQGGRAIGPCGIDGKVKVFLAGPNGDGPPILGPAGIAHMSILDFARWAGWNAGEGKRGPALVKPATLRKLHTPVFTMPPQKDAAPGTPPGGKYALGWGEVPVAWAPEPLISHGGSNGMNLAHIWLDPKRDFAMVLATNIGGAKAKKALTALEGELAGKFLKR